MIESAPKISVIIPIYNAASYLARCLDSLVGQTLQDIEIICIDDKSTDNSLEILNAYAAQDDRIKIISFQQNTGVSSARNAGIASARGEYLGFVDPDDYVDLDFYQKLYTQAINCGTDVTVANIREILFNGKQREFTKWLNKIPENKIFFNYTQWCAIYKTSFIRDNNLENPKGINSNEDTVFVVKCAVLANKIAIVSDTFYNYVRVSGSLSSEYLSDEKIDSKIKAANLILDFLNEHNLSEQDYYDAFAPMFRFISQYCFFRTTKTSTRMTMINATLDLFKKFKYEHMLQKYEAQIYPYLVCNDAEGLYEHIFKSGYRKARVTRIKLFNCIPFIRIKNYQGKRIKVSIFGIPIFGILVPHKKHGVKYNG